MLSVLQQRSQLMRVCTGAFGMVLYITCATPNAVLTMIPPQIACVRHHRPQLANADESAVGRCGWLLSVPTPSQSRQQNGRQSRIAGLKSGEDLWLRILCEGRCTGLPLLQALLVHNNNEAH